MPCRLAFPGLGIEPEAFAVVGIGAFFAGGVQAPVTGIVRATEAGDVSIGDLHVLSLTDREVPISHR